MFVGAFWPPSHHLLPNLPDFGYSFGSRVYPALRKSTEDMPCCFASVRHCHWLIFERQRIFPFGNCPLLKPPSLGSGAAGPESTIQIHTGAGRRFRSGNPIPSVACHANKNKKLT
jgi:hypothetical protein